MAEYLAETGQSTGMNKHYSQTEEAEAIRMTTRPDIEKAAGSFRRSPHWIDKYFELWERNETGHNQPFIESALIQWADDFERLLAPLWELGATMRNGGEIDREDAAHFLEGVYGCMKMLFEEHQDLVTLGTHLLPYDPMVRDRIEQARAEQQPRLASGG